jgi:hypothetical protein
MPARSPYSLKDGVVVAPQVENYELWMAAAQGKDVRATSTKFDDLLELRGQLIRLGYSLVRLSRIAA